MRLRHVFLLVLVLAGLLTSSQHGSAAGQSPVTPASIPRLEHTTFTLSNGLKVIFSQDKRLPMVAVNLWYHVGPANEIPGRTGFAHLFEHMMFQGSKNVAADTHFKLLEAAGASDINGTTNFDRTNYFETVPSNQLELALWIESDRMGYLLDVLDEKALANQRDVVRNERRQSLENQPYGVPDEALYQALYPAGHPYHGVVIGSHADLAAAQLGDVQQFFRQYYTPNNASLAIVGDFEPAAARKLVEKYFGSLKKGPDVPRITATTPPITAEKRLTVTDTVKLPRVYVGWLTPAIYKPGDADADLAAEILGGGKSSRLYKALVYDKQIAQTVTTTQESLILGSKFTIEATAKPGHTAEELEAAINEELRRFADTGPNASELERARNTIETRIITGLETLGGFGGKADRLNSYEHYLGTPDYLRQDIERYRTASVQTIKAFAVAISSADPARGALRHPRREEAGGRSSGCTDTAGRRRPERERRRAVAEGDAQAGLGQIGAVSDARGVLAAQRAEGHPQRAQRAAGRLGEPGVRQGQRRQPAGHARPGEFHRRDAGRGHEDARRPADRRRSGAARSLARHGLDDGPDTDCGDVAGGAVSADAGPRGRRHAQCHVPAGGGGAPALHPPGEPARAEEQSVADCLAGHGHGALRIRTSVWLPRPGHRGFEQGAHARRDGRLLETAHRAGECRAGRRRRDLAQAARADRGEGVRGMDGEGGPGQNPPRRARHQRKARHRRRAGSRADAGAGSRASACRGPRPTSRRSR